MLDFVFFHARPYRRFRRFLDEIGVEFEEGEGTRGMTLSVTSDVGDELTDRIARFYETLLAEQEDLLGEDDEDLSTLRLTLTDGRDVLVPIDTELLERLLSVATLDELTELVNAVVEALRQQGSP